MRLLRAWTSLLWFHGVWYGLSPSVTVPRLKQTEDWGGRFRVRLGICWAARIYSPTLTRRRIHLHGNACFGPCSFIDTRQLIQHVFISTTTCRMCQKRMQNRWRSTAVDFLDVLFLLMLYVLKLQCEHMPLLCPHSDYKSATTKKINK